VNTKRIITEPDCFKHMINSGRYIEEILYIFSS